MILAYFGIFWQWFIGGLLGVCIYGSIKRHAGVHAKSGGSFGGFIFEPWPCGMSHDVSWLFPEPGDVDQAAAFFRNVLNIEAMGQIRVKGKG